MPLLQNSRLVNGLTPLSLTTSQNATAPKPIEANIDQTGSLTTSQNATAPKHDVLGRVHVDRLTTSQNATAPKPLEQNLPCVEDELSGR